MLRFSSKQFRKNLRNRNRRPLHLELLEPRRLLISEGEAFTWQDTVEVDDFQGALSGTINWGDGTTTPLTFRPAENVERVTVRVDYSLDYDGYFTAPRRQVLEAALNDVAGRFVDDLAAIEPGPGDNWLVYVEDPRTGNLLEKRNLTINRKELLVFVGRTPLEGLNTGSAYPGFYPIVTGSDAFKDTVRNRGQGATDRPGADDVGPWGGQIMFNSLSDFYFGLSPQPPGQNRSDFYTTAAHEMMHLMGFVPVPYAFQRLLDNGRFIGTHAMAEYDLRGPVPMQDIAHWGDNVREVGVAPLMAATGVRGVRYNVTALDIAAMRDIGWTLPSEVQIVSATHTYADDGDYSIDVDLWGSVSGSLSFSELISVENVAPTLNLPSKITVAEGQVFDLYDQVIISDPGFDRGDGTEAFHVTIDWNDEAYVSMGPAIITRPGGVSRTTLATTDATWVYIEPGLRNVQVDVWDDDDGHTSGTFVIEVTDPLTIEMTVTRTSIPEDGSQPAELILNRPSSSSGFEYYIGLSLPPNTFDLDRDHFFKVGQTTLRIPLVPINNHLFDGDRQVVIRTTSSRPSEVALTILDAQSPPYQNAVNRFDVNQDGIVTPLDALLVLIFLSHNRGSHELNPNGDPEAPKVDVNGDRMVTPLDALEVLNHLRRLNLGEAESAATPEGTWTLAASPINDQILTADKKEHRRKGSFRLFGRP